MARAAGSNSDLLSLLAGQEEIIGFLFLREKEGDLRMDHNKMRVIVACSNTSESLLARAINPIFSAETGQGGCKRAARESEGAGDMNIPGAEVTIQ